MEFQLVCTGSLKEIEMILDAIQKVDFGEAPFAATDIFTESDEPKEIVPAEIMRRALRRQPLTKHTRTMLEAIYECEENEGYLSRSEICTMTDLTPTQLNGVLGRYGQRVKGTDGYDGESSYFEYRWIEETNEWSYRLPNTLRDVVRETLDAGNLR